MDTRQISQLLLPFLGGAHLTDAQLGIISTYIDLLLRWNSRINLTAIRDPEEIVTRHFGESFFAARHLFPEESCHPVRSLRLASPIARPVEGSAVKEKQRSAKSHPHLPDVILSAESVLRRKTDSSPFSNSLSS